MLFDASEELSPKLVGSRQVTKPHTIAVQLLILEWLCSVFRQYSVYLASIRYYMESRLDENF
jgi:hypothetical protein